MKLKYMLAALVLGCTIMTGCEKDNLYDDIPEGAILLNAEGFQNDDKTSVSGTDVQWVDNDIVTINGTQCTVSVSGTKQAFIDQDISATTVYGYYNCGTVNPWETTTPTVTVPDEYTCSYNGTTQVIALPMVAYSTSGSPIQSIAFKHVTAAFRVRVKNNLTNNIVVDRVSVYSTNYNLSGSTSVNLSNTPISVTAGTSTTSINHVTVNIPAGLTVTTGGTDIKEIQVPILPVPNGAKLTVEISARDATDGKTYVFNKTVTLGSDLERNAMIPASCEFKAISDYIFRANESPLTFEAMTANCTVSISHSELQYRKYTSSNSTWTDWASYSSGTTTNTIMSAAGDKVQFRAKDGGNTQINTPFSLSGNCYVYGNVMSLLSQNFSTATELSDVFTFARLFLVNRGDPPSCLYSHPTKELVLPATTLTESCYAEMFYGCSHLTRAPVLPATSLAEFCYQNMFTDCTNLSYIKCLATDISAGMCLTDWVYGVASSGTFVKNPSATFWTRGFDGIPNNWTEETATE